jgi:transposase InsO family protein
MFKIHLQGIAHIDYYNNERIQKKLGYQTPAQFKANELLRLKKEESAI